MSIDNIKRKNIIIFLFGRYLNIIKTCNVSYDVDLALICQSNIYNYDDAFKRSGLIGFYKDLGFIQGVLHSLNLVDYNDDSVLFKKLLSSVDDQSPENLY